MTNTSETRATITPVNSEVARLPNATSTFVIDAFSDDRPAGGVVGTAGAGGVTRLGADVERQIAIDHGALRLQPLITPGWGRQGIAYGPFYRVPGLTFAVSITNGHNTSQGSSIQQSLVRRIGRWALGPNADPWPARLAAWIVGPRRNGSLRRFLWWMRSTPRAYKLPNFNENLAVGWFTSESPRDPLRDGCGFVIHAAEGENGELWVRVGDRCLSAFRRLKNLQIYYLVVLREQGAIYYAAAIEGAHGLAGIPMMRPVAIDPFNTDRKLYAGVHQCALGQIGFRVDTRVQGVHIATLPEFSTPFAAAHAYDHLTAVGEISGTSELGKPWRVSHGHINRTQRGVTSQGASLAVLDPQYPSGLVHGLLETGAAPGIAGIAWRIRDDANYWLLKASCEGCTLSRIEKGVEAAIAVDQKRYLRPNATHSVQILDGHGQIGCYLDGDRLFDDWFADDSLNDATGTGIWFDGAGDIWVRDFEAHPHETPMPAAIRFAKPWKRLGTQIEISDDFVGAHCDLDGHSPTIGRDIWQRTIGTGVVTLDGLGRAVVRANVAEPHPGRTFHTLPWRQSNFADLEVTITPPGEKRGQFHNCRSGIVFWENPDNYITFSAYLDDAYNGSSVALFTKRHGFEELYDAIWTMLWDKVSWGKPFRLRVAFDGNHFIVFINEEPVMQRALTDLYLNDPPLRIARVGLAINWEWGSDTGSTFESFRVRR